MKNIIMDFGLYYEIAKKKIKLKLWSAEYSKGYLYFFLNNVADVTEELKDMENKENGNN